MQKQEQFDVDGTSLFSQESSRMPQGLFNMDHFSIHIY